MQRYTAILLIIITTLLVGLVIVPAAAAYLGPNRTITTYETQYHRTNCNYVGIKDPPGVGYCACNYTKYVGYQTSCPGINTGLFTNAACGWTGTCATGGLTSTSSSSNTESCSLGAEACTAHTVEHHETLASASVSGSITCPTSGSNGWCVSPATLNISGSEPIAGKSILAIEGTRNGESFACGGSNCTNLSLVEGANAFSFWAISSFGDSSAMGSASANVDLQVPSINGSLSGSSGENDWYITAVTLTAAAVDPSPGSGIASFQVSTNGAPWAAFGGSLTLMDGTHTVALQTADAAGWTANVSQSVKVDTQAPQLSTSLDGETSGVNLYKGKVTLSASATDDPAGSGLNRIEYQDNTGVWTTYTDPVPFYNNEHEVNVRAVDVAGLNSPVQTFSFSVESSGPVIAVQAQWQVSDTVPLEVSSSMFQLQSLSVTFSDPQNRWPEVSQSYTVSGNHFSGGIHWDGGFNGILAPSGTYTATIHATDDVGNISEVSAQITVPQPVPTSTATPTKTAVIATKTPTSQITASTTPTSTTVIETTTATPQATLAAPGAVTTPNNSAQTFSSPPNTPQPSPILPSNVLWGSAAAAVIAAATAAALEAARKRKEEEAAQKAAADAHAAEFNAAQSLIDAQIKAERAERWRLQQEEAARQAELEAARLAEEKQEAANAALQAFRRADELSMADYERYRQNTAAATAAIGASVVSQASSNAVDKKPDTWWRKTLDWVDNHQVGTAIGIGAAIGISVAAILLTGGAATPLVAALWIGGGLLASGGIIAGGTVGLNAYYGRSLGQNVLKNAAVGVISTIVTGGLAYAIGYGALLATVKVGIGASSLCAAQPTVCSRLGVVPNILDSVEQLYLGAKYTVQVAIGDKEGAAQTAIDILSEAVDGGLPGNSAAHELAESAGDLTKYVDDAEEFFEKNFERIEPLVRRFGQNGSEFIKEFGEDGIALLENHGDELVKLINHQPALLNVFKKSTNFEETFEKVTRLDSQLK